MTMETTHQLVSFLILIWVCVCAIHAYVINDKLEGAKIKPMEGAIKTKVEAENIHLETTVTADEAKNKKDNSPRKDTNVVGKLRTSNNELKDRYHKRDTVKRDKDVDIRKNSKREENEFRVQIRYSLETFIDNNDKSRDVQEKLNEHSGTDEGDVGSSSNLIIRIGRVKISNKNTDTIDEDSLNEADADNTMLPPLICFKTCPDCTETETGIRCNLRKFIKIVIPLAILFSVILPLIISHIRLKHVENATDGKGNINSDSDNEKQLLEEMIKRRAV